MKKINKFICTIALLPTLAQWARSATDHNLALLITDFVKTYHFYSRKITRGSNLVLFDVRRLQSHEACVGRNTQSTHVVRACVMIHTGAPHVSVSDNGYSATPTNVPLSMLGYIINWCKYGHIDFDRHGEDKSGRLGVNFVIFREE